MLVALVLLQSFTVLHAQSTTTFSNSGAAFVPGNRELFSLDFSREPLGPPPSSLNVLSGPMEVVEKDGIHMLRADSPSEFIVSLSDRLPDHFTLEFDVVSRMSAGSGGEELAFEGTPMNLHNGGSAQICWNHVSSTIQGGGVSAGDTWVYTPEELSAQWMGQLAQVRAEFDGPHFKLFTNGYVLYDYPKLNFVRGRVLRVYLGGQDKNNLAVHLARIRVAGFDPSTPTVAQQQNALTTDPTLQQPTSTVGPSSTTASSANSGPGMPIGITGITVTVNSNGFASVTWNPLTVSATYVVMRWKPDDPLSSYNVSPPGMPLTSASWQDGQLPTRGTYRYRVIATTSTGLIYGETLFDYQGAAPMPPPGVPTSPTSTVAVTSPTIAPAPLTTSTTTTTTPTSVALATGTMTTGTILTSPAPTTTEPVVTTMTTQPTATGMTTTTATTSTTPTAITAMPATTTGTITPMTAPPARFRVTLTGFASSRQTKDDPLQLDGHGDEIFVAAAVINWDRKLNQLTSFSFVQTRDFGDIGNGTAFGDRIKAGSSTMTGGIVATDRVPSSYDIAGSTFPAPTTDQLPLLVWEGTLNAGVDALVISPSLWEHDVIRTQFMAYKSNWSKSSPSAVFASATVSQLLSSTTLTSALAPIDGLVFAAPPGVTFQGLPTSGYKIGVLALGPNVDRPLGMRTAGPGVVIYEERLLVVTQEKVASLNVGQGTTFSLPIAEPIDIFLDGIYALFVRVERVQ